MRAGRDRTQGRPSQHEFAGSSLGAEAQQVGQIGLATAELAHRERPLGALQALAQVRFEPAGVEALVRPLVDQLGRFEAHFRSSTRATARLWTSSGPSTMRIT